MSCKRLSKLKPKTKLKSTDFQCMINRNSKDKDIDKENMSLTYSNLMQYSSTILPKSKISLPSNCKGLLNMTYNPSSHPFDAEIEYNHTQTNTYHNHNHTFNMQKGHQQPHFFTDVPILEGSDLTQKDKGDRIGKIIESNLSNLQINANNPANNQTSKAKLHEIQLQYMKVMQQILRTSKQSINKVLYNRALKLQTILMTLMNGKDSTNSQQMHQSLPPFSLTNSVPSSPGTLHSFLMLNQHSSSQIELLKSQMRKLYEKYKKLERVVEELGREKARLESNAKKQQKQKAQWLEKYDQMVQKLKQKIKKLQTNRDSSKQKCITHANNTLNNPNQYQSYNIPQSQPINIHIHNPSNFSSAPLPINAVSQVCERNSTGEGLLLSDLSLSSSGSPSLPFSSSSATATAADPTSRQRHTYRPLGINLNAGMGSQEIETYKDTIKNDKYVIAQMEAFIKRQNEEMEIMCNDVERVIKEKDMLIKDMEATIRDLQAKLKYPPVLDTHNHNPSNVAQPSSKYKQEINQNQAKQNANRSTSNKKKIKANNLQLQTQINSNAYEFKIDEYRIIASQAASIEKMIKEKESLQRMLKL